MNSIVLALLATTSVYRLELTDEVPYIVGQDNVKRQVCIVEPEQYALMTGRLHSVWRSLNSTKEGRTKLHGKIVSTVVDTNMLVKTTKYEDGFEFAESFVIKTAPVMNKFAGVKKEPDTKSIDEKPKGMSDKRWEMRKAYINRLKNKSRQVNVIHDATTGKDYTNENK